MHLVVWFAIAWVAGTATILGSLMTLGNLLLWMVPTQSPRPKKTEDPAAVSQRWQQRLKLLGFSVAISIAGLSYFILMPFPSGRG